MSVLDGAGAVHSMPSYELSERVVLFQQRFGVASTQVMKPRAIRALGVLVLDDAKHREPQPTRRKKVGAERRELLPMHHDSSSRSDALGDHVGRSGAARGATSDVIRARQSRPLAAARARPTEAS